MSQVPVSDDRSVFERAARDLVAGANGYAAQITSDAGVRAMYRSAAEKMASELRAEAVAGRMSWRKAAEMANATRNDIMRLARLATSPVGLNEAVALKKVGLNLNDAIAKATIKKFGPNAVFQRLTEAQKNAVYLEVVEAAGRSNAKVDVGLAAKSRLARRLIYLSLAISAYNILSADNKAEAAKYEGAVTGAGIGGSIAGGALAGLACGPGAPVCVAVGAFVGGTLAALGVELFW